MLMILEITQTINAELPQGPFYRVSNGRQPGQGPYPHPHPQVGVGVVVKGSHVARHTLTHTGFLVWQ